MLRCTYIILVKNNEKNIPNLIGSLKKVKGDFNKEFIIVDDGSKDDSLVALKIATRDLARTTILLQEESGSTVSVNKAISLASGDYVHFVEGHEIIHPESTKSMMEACQKLGTSVAFGLSEDRDLFSEESLNDPEIIQMPLIKILSGSHQGFSNIGKSASLVSLSLLKKVDKADGSVYTHNMSLSLRCSKYSNFAFINSVLSIKYDQYQPKDAKFLAYNNLKSVNNFAEENQEFLKIFIPNLLKYLGIESFTYSSKLKYKIYAITAKYLNYYDMTKIIGLYHKEINKLF